MLNLRIDLIRKPVFTFSVHYGYVGYPIRIPAFFQFTFQYEQAGVQETGRVKLIADFPLKRTAFLQESLLRGIKNDRILRRGLLYEKKIIVVNSQLHLHFLFKSKLGMFLYRRHILFQ